MPDWFMALVYIGTVQLFVTRALNKGMPDIRLSRMLWTIERACLAGALAGVVTLQMWLFQIAVTASVAVFLLRLVVRCFGFGLIGFARMIGSGLGVLGQVTGTLFMAFVESVPEALAESVATKPDQDADCKPFSDRKKSVLGVHEWDYTKTDWEW